MAEDDKGKSKKAEEAKEKENISKYREAFEQIRKIVGTEASLEKITSDFVRIEDANFALFNYVTEMNNQVKNRWNKDRKRTMSSRFRIVDHIARALSRTVYR
jgi:hypothetical protein